MSKWTTEIRFVDCFGGKAPEPITRFEDEDTETVLKLCQLSGGNIVYDGREAIINRPTLDPIQRKIWYVIELYGVKQ